MVENGSQEWIDKEAVEYIGLGKLCYEFTTSRVETSRLVVSSSHVFSVE